MTAEREEQAGRAGGYSDSLAAARPCSIDELKTFDPSLPSWRRMQDRETNRTGVVQRIPVFRGSGRAAAGELFRQGRNLYRPADVSASARRAGAGAAPCPAASVCGFALYGVFPSVLLGEVMRRLTLKRFPAGCPTCRERKGRPAPGLFPTSDRARGCCYYDCHPHGCHRR